MRTKIMALWIGACGIAMARPGDLDRNFDPELRAWVTPDHVTIAPDGRAWIGGGFDRGDGYSTGDLVRLGENGGVESEPASGYLERDADVIYFETFFPSVSPDVTGAVGYQTLAARPAKPFPLANGDFLLPTASLNWLRMSARGKVLGNAFPDRPFGMTLTPQFERDGKLWVIRRSSSSGDQVLERRNSVDGRLDGNFSQAPSLPTNVRSVVPAPDGGAWVLAAGDLFEIGWYPITAQPYQILQVGAQGNLVGTARTINEDRDVSLVAGPAGRFRLVYGPPRWGFYYWPSPSSSSHKIEWYSASGGLERTMNFQTGIFETFLWAEGEDGSLVVTSRRNYYPGISLDPLDQVTRLRRYGPDGREDTAFINPGRIRSVSAVAGGKWLIEGMRRMNANGSEDLMWRVPDLSRPARVQTLSQLPAGKVLATGDFATVDGFVKNRLVVFRANGAVDESFIPDERIEEFQSVAVTRTAIYVVTTGSVGYRDGRQTNLVKLRFDGSIDERFRPVLPATSWTIGNPYMPSPEMPTTLPVVIIGGVQPVLFPIATPVSFARAEQVTALENGDLLVTTNRNLGDFTQPGLTRLRADGSISTGFQQPRNFWSGTRVLALKNGGFVSGGIFYRANGSVERDLTSPNTFLTPLCEIPAGVLFSSGSSFSESSLALWTHRGFASWFRPPALDWNKPVVATSGEFGMIYLAATLVNGRPSVHRLLPTGQIDQTFRGPVFESRERQFGRNWWQPEESGKVPFDPALVANQGPMYSQAVLWHPSTRSLWTGGDFNMVNGQPRDGLAQIAGGFSWRRWR